MTLERAIFTEAHHQQFEEYGFVRLGPVLTKEELGQLQKRIDDLMLGKVRMPGVTFQLDPESEHYEDVNFAHTDGPSHPTLAHRRVDELHNDPLFLAYMQRPLFREITRRYIGEDVSIFRSMFMNKPAHKGTELPWHQDVGAGWGIDSNPITTVWTALDDATVATGCMQIVPGSHKLGILNERHYTSEADQAVYCTDDEIADLEVAAGEAILLHNWLLHRSGVNVTGQPRRAFSVAYMDANTRSVSTGATFPVIFGENALVPAGIA